MYDGRAEIPGRKPIILPAEQGHHRLSTNVPPSACRKRQGTLCALIVDPILPEVRIDILRSRKDIGISLEESDMPPISPPELEIGLDKLCYIIIKAREFDA
jgi:hypothetical protein